eukprot:comp14728_c0_seq1/m.11121 comp14728_c0_seq1/g.11121  ORF comp14728_c0_seq1/g.11121 comp14728_c0_seq1/m.11121 type:complete len:373 (-) comp14728_c0_seq1:185-1303(-)
MTNEQSQTAPEVSQAAVFMRSSVPENADTVVGYDFSQGVDYEKMFKSYLTTGYQATSLAQAINEINRMIKWRLSDEPIAPDADEEQRDPNYRAQRRCKIFLGYTSNLISSGLRETFRYLAQNRMVDVIVSSAGGVEEDFIKCLAPTYVGDFALKGLDLRKKGINRIGNLLVPNDNYCKFEDWVFPILDAMLHEQNTHGVRWTPSKMIARLGKEINNPESVYYWAYKHNIPVFCPAITDGSLGDMLYFHSFRNPGLVLDLVEDIRRINSEAVFASHTGMIILGGGVIKHHICNANLMRNGADYSVFINTGQEFDGSDSGARPDEAVSWGKIKITAEPVKVYTDATLVFPIVVAETFAKHFEPKTDKVVPEEFY